jgi:hypothetical protein
LVRSIYPPRLGIRLLGVTVSTFGSEEADAETGQFGLDLGMAS